MTWEYKGNTHPTSYIKFRGWESQVHCKFGTGKGHLSCFLGLNQTKSGVCDVPVYISDVPVWILDPGWSLWCPCVDFRCPCVDFRFPAISSLCGVIQWLEVDIVAVCRHPWMSNASHLGLSLGRNWLTLACPWVAQLLLMAGPCLELGIFFVGLERMDDGKDGCLSHTLLPYGLPTGGMTWAGLADPYGSLQTQHTLWFYDLEFEPPAITLTDFVLSFGREELCQVRGGLGSTCVIWARI